MNHPTIQRAVELDDPKLAKDALQEIEVLLRASSDQEEKLYLLFSRANCYEILGNFEEARVHLALALRERPDESSKTTFDFMQALFCQREEKYAEALERFTNVLTVHSEELKRTETRFLYEDIQTRRAFLSVTLRKFQDAIPLLRETLSFELSKELRSDVFASLGLCHLAQRVRAVKTFLPPIPRARTDKRLELAGSLLPRHRLLLHEHASRSEAGIRAM
jgi:tetratricopeptide (TPR) repeat protein